MKGFRLIHALALLGGLLFLYLPVVILVLYSFNASRLVTVWGGFSTQWYRSLMENEALKDAALLSLGVAAASATLATMLGTLAALALDRARPGRAKLLFGGLIAAPIVMPEVLTGLSLLLLFVALDIGRGGLTVTLAHATLTLCFVTMIVEARLATLDRSLAEAAQDLGASPWRVTLTITLPLALPAIVAGWLLAFTLSFDDLVIASFTTGPGATTLPMRIYSAMRLGVSPEINAISTLLIAGVAAIVVTASLILKRDRLMAG